MPPRTSNRLGILPYVRASTIQMCFPLRETSRRLWHALENSTAVQRSSTGWTSEPRRPDWRIHRPSPAVREESWPPTPSEAQALFAASAAALEEVGPIPFEDARTLLCSGEAMRRDGCPAAAREPLRSALGLFESLGARPWANRARAELAASGVKDRRATESVARPDQLQKLSPQELQVARIAGRGQNNVEVAAALFVSRKTVEAHLTRVYRKLGIRSRTELARILVANGIAD